MFKKMLSILSLISFSAQAGNYLDNNLKKLNWNGVDVIWLEDNQYPTYTFNVYFSAGALQDREGKLGESELTLNQLTTGTNRYSQKEIVDSLEFYGAAFSANVTHEYSTYSVGGLVKDMIPTMKMVCHLFRNATFPQNELSKTKKRMSAGLKNMVTSHSALANRVYREFSLSSTPYAKPVSGTLKSISEIQGKDLAEKLKFLNDKVKKRIYISGPSQVAKLKDVIVNDCKWTEGEFEQVSPEVKEKATYSENTIHLVPVPNANQAQIRVGRFLTADEAQTLPDLRGFAAKYMGGGFTSQLMKELRVKRGLTYSAGAYSSSQKKYGRSGINTFTKNETIVEALKVIEQTIKNNSENIPSEFFNHSQRFVKGSYLFTLESTHAFLNNLIYFDHIGRDYKEIYEYQDNIASYTAKDLAKTVSSTFKWKKQLVMVLGSVDLKKKLEKAGYKVIVIDYKDYL
jgi:zinc protease